jgi:ribosomal protein S18 acetylase RimI-like enzyme
MIRQATIHDLEALVELENASFSGDRVSRRSFRHMLTKGHASTLVDDDAGRIRGYVLLLFSKITALARLYSIAVSPAARGHGVGRALVAAAEEESLANDCIAVRLEIRRDNDASLSLFRACGYDEFGVVEDYYDDHTDAIRFEKHLTPQLERPSLARVPYYSQTLGFTCGPAALMMAMKAIDPSITLDRRLELRIWREATSVFMTRGHGGCGPYGLSLSAYHRGLDVEFFVKEKGVFLGKSVRSADKREVMRLVQEDFLEEIAGLPIAAHYRAIGAEELQAKFDDGGIPIVLISSYRIYRKHAPHWLVVTGFDGRFVYAHDPLVDTTENESAADCINMPIPRREFERLASYGAAGQKAVVIVRARDGSS